jgi:tRNA pseudouridine13 synthase
MLLPQLIAPPLLTGDLPGIGGRIKFIPEDFEVEEIPAYPPCGNGDFFYLWIEKRDMGAEYFTRQVARRLDIAAGEVGTAGLKDRRAVTRQMVSVPTRVEDRIPQLDGDGIRVLSVNRHGNKLRPGHLHGNRFRILIRDVRQEINAGDVLPAAIARLQQQGVPNYYGPQRFGRDGETWQMGLALLRGEKPPVGADGRMPNLRNPFVRKLALSAAQAGLFNCYLAQRLTDGLLHRVLPGDVMCKLPFGGMFVAEDLDREQQRFDARETVPGGPIFGRKTFPTRAEAATREQAVLDAFTLTAASFAGFGKLVQGTRRHNLLFPTDLSAAIRAEGVELWFALPAGSYATVLLREIMKTDAVDTEDG